MGFNGTPAAPTNLGGGSDVVRQSLASIPCFPDTFHVAACASDHLDDIGGGAIKWPTKGENGSGDRGDDSTGLLENPV